MTESSVRGPGRKRWLVVVAVVLAVIAVAVVSAPFVVSRLIPPGVNLDTPDSGASTVGDLVDMFHAGSIDAVESSMGRELSAGEFAQMREAVTPFPAAGLGRVAVGEPVHVADDLVEYRVEVSALNLNSTTVSVFVLKRTSDKTWLLQTVRRDDFSP